MLRTISMFAHNKRLQYSVHVPEGNPALANLMLEQFGGPQVEPPRRCVTSPGACRGRPGSQRHAARYRHRGTQPSGGYGRWAAFRNLSSDCSHWRAPRAVAATRERRPSSHPSNTTGSMYALRHTAGVLQSVAATALTTSLRCEGTEAPAGSSGAPMAANSRNATNVPPQVRKSLAVNPSPMVSCR